MSDPQIGKSAVGPRTFLTVQEFIWYNCSAVCRLSAQWLYGRVNGNLSKRAYGIKIARRNINNLKYTGDTTFMAESEEESKSFLMKVKEESEKAGLKLNTQKMKIMASGPITSWQIDGKTMQK